MCFSGQIISVSQGMTQESRLKPCTTALRMYDGGLVYSDGKVDLQLHNPVSGGTFTLRCKVVKEAIAPILSFKTSLRLGLLDVRDCDPLNYVYRGTTPGAPADESSAGSPSATPPRDERSRLTEEYRDVFDKNRVGLIMDNYEIITDPSAVPVVDAPRRVRVHTRDKLQKKLDELKALGVVSP